MSNDFLDLASLPDPLVIESLTYEEILQRKLETFIASNPAFSALVESDPAIKLIEASAYDEITLRQRINDAAKARLLAFAVGGDLDQLAAFYGVTRLLGELDTPFKARVRQAIMAKSAAGTEAQYRFAALSASTDVLDVRVDSPAGGIVRVSILSAVGDGTPTSELLAAVEAVVLSPSVYALCHTVQVVPAAIVPVDVAAQIWLDTTAPSAIFTGLENMLRNQFTAARGLGWNVSASWLTAKLQISGVQRVAMAAPAPATQIVIEPNQCATLGTVTLVLAGRDY